MRRSIDRIITSHAGSLPRPAEPRDMIARLADGGAVDQPALSIQVRSAVADVVRKQVQSGSGSAASSHESSNPASDRRRSRVEINASSRVFRQSPELRLGVPAR